MSASSSLPLPASDEFDFLTRDWSVVFFADASSSEELSSDSSEDVSSSEPDSSVCAGIVFSVGVLLGSGSKAGVLEYRDRKLFTDVLRTACRQGSGRPHVTDQRQTFGSTL